jgi:hypothetical protein
MPFERQEEAAVVREALWLQWLRLRREEEEEELHLTGQDVLERLLYGVFLLLVVAYENVQLETSVAD